MTDFSDHLYYYSQLPKDLFDTLQQAPAVFEDILVSFCVRNKIKPSWTLTDLTELLVVRLTVQPEQETLELYQAWKTAWSMHGYHSPLLDIQIIQN